jgi:Flp pilus assembly protein TadG
MTWTNHLGKHAKRLLACDRGAVAPMVGIAAIMLIGAVGVAVDVGRGQVAQSKLQASLDAAGLAAGALVGQNLSEDLLKPEAEKYLNVNFNGETIDAAITNFDLDLSEDNAIVTLEATASLPTTFMRIFGRNSMQVAARSEITRETTGLEVALVLDVTGSMEDPVGGTGTSAETSKLKIVALRESAVKLVDALFGSNEEVDDLWVGVVPFSQSVNIGTNHADWMLDLANYTDKVYCSGSKTSGTPRCPNDIFTISNAKVSTTTTPITRVDKYMDASPSSWYFKDPTTGERHAWGGCVLERWDNDRDVTDDPPSTQGWETYFVPDTNWNGDDMGNNNWRGPTNESGSNSGKYLVNKDHDGDGLDEEKSANKGCPEQAITTFTNKRSDLTTAKAAVLDAKGNVITPAVPGTTGAIDVLLYPRGNTHINVGAVWGWRLLSPEWNGVWGGTMDSNDLPLDYDEPLSQKVMILMTDGENTMSSSIYTAYGFMSENHLGTTSSTSVAKATLNTKTANICSAMKAKGILIYTIVFGNGSTTVAKNLMKACASEEDYYFDSGSQKALESAFATIGDSLSKLRVSH